MALFVSSDAKKRIFKYKQLYSIMLIPLVHVFLFRILPIFGIAISFQEFRISKGIFGSRWIGLDNFFKLFNSNYFGDIFSNTLILNLLNLLIGFPFPVIFALFLNEVKKKYFKKSVQMVAYAPHFISTVVIVGIIFQLLDPTVGFLKFIVGKEAAADINLIGDPKAFRPIFITSGIWQHLGWSSVIYSAALAGVDPTLYDSAAVDGAGKLHKIWHIDLPSIMPIITISLILAMGRVMNSDFEKVYLLQNNMNIGTSEVISTFVYKRGLIHADFGFSSAVGFFNSIINFVLILTTNYTSKKLSGESMF